MVEVALTGQPAFRPTADASAGAGVTLTMRADGRQAILLARRGQADSLMERWRSSGVTLPPGPGRMESRGIGAVWTAPGQWLVDWEDREAEQARRLLGSFASLCSVVRADDARTHFAVGGPRARDTLSKMLTIDLHPRAFRPGDAAVTVAGGISVTLWLGDDSPLFECAVPRSYARSFWDWLCGSAAEYGVTVIDEG